MSDFGGEYGAAVDSRQTLVLTETHWGNSEYWETAPHLEQAQITFPVPPPRPEKVPDYSLPKITLKYLFSSSSGPKEEPLSWREVIAEKYREGKKRVWLEREKREGAMVSIARYRPEEQEALLGAVAHYLQETQVPFTSCYLNGVLEGGLDVLLYSDKQPNARLETDDAGVTYRTIITGKRLTNGGYGVSENSMARPPEKKAVAHLVRKSDGRVTIEKAEPSKLEGVAHK